MPAPRPSSLQIRALTLACWLFCGVGLWLTLAGDSGIFAPWHDAAEHALFAGPAPGDLAPLVALNDGILGGSIVGKWLAALWLVRYPLADGRRWAHNALVIGLLAWFLFDSAASVYFGAVFNLWMINLAPLLLFGGLLAWVRPRCTQPSLARPPMSRAWLVATIACAVLTGAGVVVALGTTTPLFGLYREMLAQTWYGGVLPPHVLLWFRFSAAVVGAAVFGHGVMLTLLMRHAPGERWALDAVAVSMVGWFVVDSTASIAYGGWFNVVLLNIPSFLSMAIPWWFAHRQWRSQTRTQRTASNTA